MPRKKRWKRKTDYSATKKHAEQKIEKREAKILLKGDFSATKES